MDGASRGLAFGAGNMRITRLRSIGPPLYSNNCASRREGQSIGTSCKTSWERVRAKLDTSTTEFLDASVEKVLPRTRVSIVGVHGSRTRKCFRSSGAPEKATNEGSAPILPKKQQHEPTRATDLCRLAARSTSTKRSWHIVLESCPLDKLLSTSLLPLGSSR